MKKILSIALVCFFTQLSVAQNIGIGTTTPAEKLDVNGNINISGQLKVNGNAGTANQVLTKNASNLPSWVNLGGYKNYEVYDNNSIANTAGTGNSTTMWTVPVGVTEVFIEGWSGGGGGGYGSGGGGGGYAAFKLTVVPGASVSLQVGAGGNFASSITNGIQGGSTIITNSSYTVTIFGGFGGSSLNPAVTNTSINPPPGGYATGNVAPYLYTEGGRPGNASKVSFVQIAANDFAKVVNYGDGGDAGQSPDSGVKGGYFISGASFSGSSAAVPASVVGGGGGADVSSGYQGKGGRIIIHY